MLAAPPTVLFYFLESSSRSSCCCCCCCCWHVRLPALTGRPAWCRGGTLPGGCRGRLHRGPAAGWLQQQGPVPPSAGPAQAGGALHPPRGWLLQACPDPCLLVCASMGWCRCASSAAASAAAPACLAQGKTAAAQRDLSRLGSDAGDAAVEALRRQVRAARGPTGGQQA